MPDWNGPQRADSDEYWISISDLMTGLMVIFLLVAIAYMLNVETQRRQIEEIAVAYDSMRAMIYDSLQAEFQDDLG